MFITRKTIQFFILIFPALLSNFSFGQTNEFKGWSSVQYGIEINDFKEIETSIDYGFEYKW